ncbi:MAG: ABC transporter ATP-binding protein [Planctomycetes bacterium]|nr:ABC transporter ATP-binding protein [Planctomycetota bacterium]
MVALVEVKRLSKRFGARAALTDVSFAVAPGEIVALVGANGSGKSTLLRLMAGLLRPSAGTVSVLGHEPFTQREEVMRDARFAFAPPSLFDSLTAREQLVRLTASPSRSVDSALATVGLAERADDRVRTYSFGMRQRLAIAQALLPPPRLLVLDEPSEGLDPAGVRELRALLLRLRAECGVAIVLASHLSSEVESLADRVVVLDSGRVVFAGSVAELRAGGERLVLGVAAMSAARTALASAGIVATPRGSTELLLQPPVPDLTEMQALLSQAGVELLSYHVETPSLEEALLARAARATP